MYEQSICVASLQCLYLFGFYYVRALAIETAGNERNMENEKKNTSASAQQRRHCRIQFRSYECIRLRFRRNLLFVMILFTYANAIRMLHSYGGRTPYTSTHSYTCSCTAGINFIRARSLGSHIIGNSIECTLASVASLSIV